MQLQIGSTLVRNPDGAICVNGVELMRLECGEDGQLLLSLDVYDLAGTHIARLWRNAWAFNDESLTRIDTVPEKLMLTRTDSGERLIEVDILDTDTIRIAQAAYYDISGRHIMVVDNEWRIDDSPALAGQEIDAAGGGVDITL